MTVEQETERLTDALAREAAALSQLESLEPRLQDAKGELAMAQQAVESTSGAFNSATSDRRKHETQVEDAERELERLSERLAIMTGERADDSGSFESKSDADALKRVDRKQARASPPGRAAAAQSAQSQCFA